MSEALSDVVRQTRITGVEAIRVLPDYTEIQTEGSGAFLIRMGQEQIKLLAKGLSVLARGRKKAIATFLYFPEGERATVLVEENGTGCTLVVNEGSAILRRQRA